MLVNIYQYGSNFGNIRRTSGHTLANFLLNPAKVEHIACVYIYDIFHHRCFHLFSTFPFLYSVYYFTFLLALHRIPYLYVLQFLFSRPGYVFTSSMLPVGIRYGGGPVATRTVLNSTGDELWRATVAGPSGSSP